MLTLNVSIGLTAYKQICMAQAWLLLPSPPRTSPLFFLAPYYPLSPHTDCRRLADLQRQAAVRDAELADLYARLAPAGAGAGAGEGAVVTGAGPGPGPADLATSHSSTPARASFAAGDSASLEDVCAWASPPVVLDGLPRTATGSEPSLRPGPGPRSFSAEPLALSRPLARAPVPYTRVVPRMVLAGGFRSLSNPAPHDAPFDDAPDCLRTGGVTTDAALAAAVTAMHLLSPESPSVRSPCDANLPEDGPSSSL
jgi:hypothetical protein